MEGHSLNRRLLIPAILLALPVSAEAHLVSTGFGSYYDGMAHFLVTPADWLVVVALGLLAGLGGATTGRAMLVSLPLGWIVGGFAGWFWPGSGDWPFLSVLSFGGIGALVALDWKPPSWVVAGLAGIFGALHGWINGASMAGGDRTWLALLGIGSAVFVLATVLPAVVVSLRPAWTRIAVRVLGSWIVAIGLLMLGWLMHGKG